MDLYLFITDSTIATTKNPVVNVKVRTNDDENDDENQNTFVTLEVLNRKRTLKKEEKNKNPVLCLGYKRIDSLIRQYNIRFPSLSLLQKAKRSYFVN